MADPQIELWLAFGALEARLAEMHQIATEKRTQFQARLRNLQRMGIAADVERGPRKAAYFRPGPALEMALAVELTQLGVTPERIMNIFRDNRWPIFTAGREAAWALGRFAGGAQREGDRASSVFLFFDPTALQSLMENGRADSATTTFYSGTVGEVEKNLARWMSTGLRRLSLINVTAVIEQLCDMFGRGAEKLERAVLDDIERWSADGVVKYADQEKARWSARIAELGEGWRDEADLIARLSSDPMLRFALGSGIPEFWADAALANTAASTAKGDDRGDN